MVQEFDDALRGVKPGERTGIFETDFGYHIAQLHEHTPAGYWPLDVAGADIRGSFTIRNREQVFMRGLAKLREAADIRWVPEGDSPK